MFTSNCDVNIFELEILKILSIIVIETFKLSPKLPISILIDYCHIDKVSSTQKLPPMLSGFADNEIECCLLSKYY